MGWGGMNAVATPGTLALAVAGVVFVLALFRGKPVAADDAGAAPQLPGTPDPALAAGGLALLTMGTLPGWLVGLAGAVMLAVGGWRMTNDARL